ncbi:MAG: aconitate hydratase [Deltaproteobacteria bacterium]|nr:aconitate hydratase [Deltaproteobacteria bacterium]
MTTVSDPIETTADLVRQVYGTLERNLAVVRKRLGRPMSLAEKVLYGHLCDPVAQVLMPGTSMLALRPDRLAMQDATAQMALLQFMLAGRETTALPTTVHCDHLIRAEVGAERDMAMARQENAEVYQFLASASQRYRIGFWEPGAGIIHQVVLEQYAFPGGMMLGTDSHTPNAGGLGMIAVGVGGADAVDVMVGMPWNVLSPHVIGVRLTGQLNGWTAPKDVILKVCHLLTTKGGTNRIIEYFGPGASAISCTGKATITNMGAELGATTSIFPYDARMRTYLGATNRQAIAALADQYASLLSADPEVEATPERYFQEVLEIDLSTLEPHIVGPHSPDVARPISQLKKDVRDKGYPDQVNVFLIGSCTNSSYEDLERAADVARQAKALGLRAAGELLVTPGSEQIHQTIRRDGQLAMLEAIGGVVLANACGPCIGQWRRHDVALGESNSIVTSYNRNFPKRNDGSPQTLAFIGSPEVVTAMSLAGRLSFDPLHDPLTDPSGHSVRLQPPAKAPEIPARGFVESRAGYCSPPADAGKTEVVIAPESERLQRLTPFPAWDGRDFTQLPLLLKAAGKCTTDHISQAGVWLRYRGHLERISDNAFLGAVNAFTGESGTGKNLLTGETASFPEIAKAYRQQGLQWVVVGDENYGEGSSREHAAMSPRFLGCAAVLTRSFARIHETNLKKQGVLPLTFADPADYDKVREGDSLSVIGLPMLSPGTPLTVRLHHADGSAETFPVRQSLTTEQILWFKAGSALNALRQGLLK